MKEWFAVQKGIGDNDCSRGSFDLEEAKNLVRQYPDGHIAVIDSEYGLCIDVLWLSDLEA